MPRDDAPSTEDPLDVERRALEAARAALYRADADDDSRRRYARLAEQYDLRRAAATAFLGTDRVRRGVRWTRRTRITVPAVVGGVIAAILIGALALPRSLSVRMSPMHFVGATDPTAEEAAVLSLFAGSFAAQNKLALRAVVDAPPALASGRTQRSSVREITRSGVLAVPHGITSGTVTVVVLCTSASTFRWELTVTQAAHRQVLATSSGRACSGAASYATMSVRDERGARLRIDSERDGRLLVALVVVPD